MLGLGQTTSNGIPLPGHAIPYAYTQDEINTFLAMFSTDPTVSNYLYTKQPTYGVIFTPPGGYGQLLLWFDASGVFHVIDVTNMSIATQVQQAPYESPDASILNNIYDQVQAIIASLPSPQQALSTISIIGVAVALYLAVKLVKE